jgi:hypothetical protein
MSGFFTLTDHDFAHSLVQKVVFISSPARLRHVIRHLPSDLVLPTIALGVLNGLFSGIKVQLMYSSMIIFVWSELMRTSK